MLQAEYFLRRIKLPKLLGNFCDVKEKKLSKLQTRIIKPNVLHIFGRVLKNNLRKFVAVAAEKSTCLSVDVISQ